MAYVDSLIEDWECRLDAASRRRYYYQGNFVAAKQVPSHVLNKIDCTSASEAKQVESVKKSPTKKVAKKAPSKTAGSLVPPEVKFGKESYFSLLPRELREKLLLHIPDNRIKIVCEIEQFMKICADEQFWKKLYMENFTENISHVEKMGKFKGWQQYYLDKNKIYNNRLKTVKERLKMNLTATPTQKQLDEAEALYISTGHHWDKKIPHYVVLIDDPVILYQMLNIAANQGNFEAAKKIIAKLAKQKTTWLDIYATLVLDVTHRELYQKYGENINTYYSSASPIDAAIDGGHIDMTHWLIDNLPKDLQPHLVNKIFESAFLYAVATNKYNNNLPIIDYFLENYPNVPYDYEHALALAADSGDITMIKFLIDDLGVNPQAKNNYVLHSLSSHPSVEIIKYLIDKGIDIHANNDELLRQIMVYYDIHEKEAYDLVKFLLDNDADVNANNGEPLKEALDLPKTKSKSLIKLLVSKGADTTNLTAEQKLKLNKLLKT